MMMFLHCGLWGLLATVVFTVLLSLSQALGLTRMNIPYLLGTLFTVDRDRAKLYGAALHFVLGVSFSLLYLLAFTAWGGANWWKGLLLGAAQGAFFLTVVLPLMPGLHPHMASEQEGPTVVRQLEPPGFLGLHYGVQTPISIFAAHLVWGLMLGVTLLSP